MITNHDHAQDCLAHAREAFARDAAQAAMYWLARAQVYATLAAAEAAAGR